MLAHSSCILIKARIATAQCGGNRRPGFPVVLRAVLLFLGDELVEFGLVFGGPARARLGVDDLGGFGLADALTGVGLDGLSGGKGRGLSFGHFLAFSHSAAGNLHCLASNRGVLAFLII